MSCSRLFVQRSRRLVTEGLNPPQPEPHVAVFLVVNVEVPLIVRQLERVLSCKLIAPAQTANNRCSLTARLDPRDVAGDELS